VVGQLQLLLFAALAYVVLKKRGLYPKEARRIYLDSDVVYRKLAPTALTRLWTGALGPAWSGALGAGRGALGAVLGLFYRWTGPGGMFGRSWTTSVIAVWSAAMLAFYLLFIFLGG
ncbi:MAG: Na(+)/H(+) antiporter subunit D, partial [Acidobacteriota bacterium]